MALAWYALGKIWFNNALAYNQDDLVPDANVTLYGYDTLGLVEQRTVTAPAPGVNGVPMETSAHAAATYVAKAGVQKALVTTNESTTSTSFVNLATVGPAVTVTIPASGTALVLIDSYLYNSNVSEFGLITAAMSGANTSSDIGVILARSSPVTFNGVSASAHVWLTGLTPGSTTFTLKYRVTGSTGNFYYRQLIVIPF